MDEPTTMTLFSSVWYFLEELSICDRLHSCNDYSIAHPPALMMYRLSEIQLFHNVPKSIPKAFLERRRELLWHMDQIWWFVWNWSAQFLPLLSPSSPSKNKNESASHYPIIPKQRIINNTLYLRESSFNDLTVGYTE